MRTRLRPESIALVVGMLVLCATPALAQFGELEAKANLFLTNAFRLAQVVFFGVALIIFLPKLVRAKRRGEPLTDHVGDFVFLVALGVLAPLLLEGIRQALS